MALKKNMVEDDGPIHIESLKQAHVTFRLMGTTPFYCNAMSAKAKRDLLIGGGKKTAAEKAANIKHDPEEEFRNSIYRLKDGPTLLGFPAPGVKSAMATAALETKGMKKTSAQRLIFMPENKIKIWGRPYLKCDVVRSADMAKTPDVRTRAFLPQWCAEVTISYITPALTPLGMATLLANAGMIIGLGDYRQEKGKGSFGTFRVFSTEMDDDDQAAWDYMTRQDRAVQEEAMENPVPADDETEELLAAVAAEQRKRAAAPPPKEKTPRAAKASA